MLKLVFALLLALVAGLQLQVARADRCDGTTISSPADGESIGGIITIVGRANLPDAFARYEIEFTAAGREQWVVLNALPLAVATDSVLARWDTQSVAEGMYELRVRAVDRSGNYCEHALSVRVARAAAKQNPETGTIRIPMLTSVLELPIPRAPPIGNCTHSWEVGAVVTKSMRLCPAEYYIPFEIRGDNIAVIGDDAASAVIYSEVGFAITARGNNIYLARLHVIAQTLPSEAEQWLCLYNICYFNSRLHQGGVAYGGGILLTDGSNATIVDSRIEGGAIGIALQNRRGDRLIGNALTDLTGWGVFAENVADEFWIDNSIERINRACQGPDYRHYDSGCETGGIVCLGCVNNVIANNRCAATSNCFYLQGEGGNANNFNKFYGNRCDAPTQNCFEIAYSDGNEFDNNTARLPQGYSAGCGLWLVYARVKLGTTNQFPPCDQRGARLESSIEYVAGKP